MIEYRKELGLESFVAVVAIASHGIAFWMASWGILVMVYLGCMFALTRFGSIRRGFYFGLAIGLVSSAIQLRFFMEIFSVGAVALWAILGLWSGFFLATMRAVRLKLSPVWMLLTPFVWTGFEYTRSELYPLRFSWLAPGMALSHPRWNGLASLGFYGFSFTVLVILSLMVIRMKWQLKLSSLAVTSLACVAMGMRSERRQTTANEPYVAGIQFEFADGAQVLKGLNRLIEAHPKTDIVVLSENAFSGPIPLEIRNWCRDNERHLVAGGKELSGNGPNDFRNTVFVVDSLGEVVHKQAKSVPIQFFNDGEAATTQVPWDSPWGPIGIAICYDLSYSLVMDRFISAGAKALIIPTMDVEDWGEYEHSLHAKIPYVRAREYGVPIFRVASSGVSQLVSAQGKAISSAPFPGPGRMLGGRMTMSSAGRVPLNRSVAQLSVVVVVGLIFALIWQRVAQRRGPTGKESFAEITCQS